MENTVPATPAFRILAAASLELRYAARAYAANEDGAAHRLNVAAIAYAAARANWELNRD